MSRLVRIKVEHYRAFQDGLVVELRPLTLVYGKNNSGKSSIVRLLGILGDSLGDAAESPLHLSGDAGRGSTFTDILSARDRELKQLALTLIWEDGRWARWRIGLVSMDRIELVQVEALDIGHDGLSTDLRVDGWYHHPRVPGEPRPEQATPLRPPGAVLEFRGLAPRLSGEDDHPLLRALHSRLLALRGHIQYLSAVRAELPSSFIERNERPTSLSARGEKALEVLLYDGEVRAEVTSWLRREVQRDLIDRAVGPRAWQWLLSPVDAPELDIPLSAAGEGMAQLLPILVALGLRRSPTRPDGMDYLAMEEPTTHLHDDLQIQLAAHLAALVKSSPTPPTIVLETHARPLLLGVQLAIRHGLDPSLVTVYWVSQDAAGVSRAEPIEFDRSGAPTSQRLRTAFQDERRLLRDLAAAYMNSGVEKIP